MEIEITFIDFIKPSSPTPSHLRTHKISLIDQYGPNCYGPVLYFYSTTSIPVIEEKCRVLKQSLSETLTLYYPLAGKVKDNLSIDCNDEGLCYIEAKCNLLLDDYLGSQLDLSSLEKLFPHEIELEKPLISGSHVGVVQQTNFACGGIAIAFLSWHVIFDGTMVTSFIKTWAALARHSKEDVILPSFIASTIFPQNSSFPQTLNTVDMLHLPIKPTILSMRRFYFSGSSIAKLKSQLSIMGHKASTRAEAVASLLTKCFMDAKKVTRGGIEKSTLVNIAVNLRRKAIPPLLEGCVGNLVLSASLLLNGEEGLNEVVWKMREASSTINSDLVKRLEGKQGLTNFLKFLQEARELISNSETEFIGYNNWCGFGLYTVDYGWGKPLWFPFIGLKFKNFVILMEAKDGEGIEAWLIVDEKVQMAILEHDSELLSLAILDPSPLQLSNIPIPIFENIPNISKL